MSRPSILFAAQTFGFGPSATLFSIARALTRGINSVLLEGDGPSPFNELNPEVFAHVERGAAKEVVERVRPSAVLSVMAPDVVLHARVRGIRSYYVDSLPWFWTVTDAASFPTLAENAIATSRLPNLPPHDAIVLGHSLADRSFVQHDAGLRERRDLVGALIPPLASGPRGPRRHILVTTSGGILAGVDVEHSANYVELAVRLAHELARECFAAVPWTVLVNPILLRILRRRGTPLETLAVSVRASVSQTEMSRLTAESFLVLTPPGLHTIYECARLRTPVVFLPEGSSQYRNAERLAEYGYPVLGRFLHDLDGEACRDADGLQLLYDKLIPRHLANPARLVPELTRRCREMECETTRANVVDAQRAAALRMVRDFDGASQVAAEVERELLTAAPTAP